MVVLEVSFILSDDEVFSLMSLFPDRSVAGQGFMDEALGGAVVCDLSGLVGKGLARVAGGQLELVPVVRMVADALARGDSVSRRGEVWDVRSKWVSLVCERYLFRDGHWKISPYDEGSGVREQGSGDAGALEEE